MLFKPIVFKEGLLLLGVVLLLGACQQDRTTLTANLPTSQPEAQATQPALPSAQPDVSAIPLVQSSQPTLISTSTLKPSTQAIDPTEVAAETVDLPVLQEYPVPPGSRPHDVAPALDGGVWYAAQGSGELGWLDPVSGATRQIPLGSGSAAV